MILPMPRDPHVTSATRPGHENKSLSMLAYLSKDKGLNSTLNGERPCSNRLILPDCSTLVAVLAKPPGLDVKF